MVTAFRWPKAGTGIILFGLAIGLFIFEIQLATKALDTHIEDLEEIKLLQSN